MSNVFLFTCEWYGERMGWRYTEWWRDPETGETHDMGIVRIPNLIFPDLVGL